MMKSMNGGNDSDVIYVRCGKEFHYYNHNLDEILTDVDFIEEDAEPECPYSIGEDQNRNVMLCVEDGYKNIDNTGWLKWWSKGWEIAKEVRKLLPEDIEITYGHISQAVQVLEGSDLNTESLRLSFPKHMKNRIDEGLYIPNAYVDWEMNDDEHDNYMFNLHGYEHDLHPNDRGMLGVHGRPQYQTGTVKQSSPTRLLIHTDWPLDISEAYSIELIL